MADKGGRTHGSGNYTQAQIVKIIALMAALKPRGRIEGEVSCC